MTAVLIVGIVFGSIVAIVAIIFFSSNLKRQGTSFRQSGKIDAAETRLIQEIHQGLSKMEKRVDALETILFDREAREVSHTEGKEEDQ